MKKLLTLLAVSLLLSTAMWGQVVNTFPHFTDFESEATCGTGCTTPCNLTGHWRNQNQWGLPIAGQQWIVDVGGTSSSNTGPAIDHTLGNSTGKYLYTETSGCNNLTAFLTSGYYNFTNASAPIINFWYHMYGATMGTMHLDVDTTQGMGAWVQDVIPSWTDNVDLWQEKTASLAAFGGKDSVRIRIRAITGTSFTSDMAVDDILIFQPQPNDLNVIGVSAGGGCGNSPTTPVDIWVVNFGTDSIATGTAIPVSFEIGGVTVTDTFIAGQTYFPGDTITYTFTNGFADLSGPSAVNITAWAAWSLDSSTGNDTTATTAYGIPIISNYPYYENFDAGQNGWVINNASGGTWAFGTPAKTVIIGASSAPNCFVSGGLTGDYNNNDNSWVEGPCFDFSNICDPVITADVWWNAEFSWDGMNITASSDGGNTWVLIGNYLDPLNWYNDNTIVGNPGGFQSGWSGRNSSSNGSGGWVNARHRMVGFGGESNVKIRFNFGSDGSVIDDGCAFDNVRIFNGTDFGPDQLLCGSGSVTLNAYHGNASATYLWSDGSSGQTLNATMTGTYSVTIDAGGGCIVSETMNLMVVDSNTTASIGPDTTVCGGPYVLDPGAWPMSTFLWSSGDTTPTLSVSTTGTYAVAISNICGVYGDSALITVSALPVVDLGQDTTACDSYTLDAGNTGSTYMWSTGDSSQTISATASGTYSVMVMNASGCSSMDSVMLVVGTSPQVSLGPDSVLCDGASATINAGNAGMMYMWSTGDTTQTITTSTSGTYTVTVSDPNGCAGTDDIIITAEVSPSASFNFTVGGSGLDYSFNDQTTGNVTTYAWDFGDGNTSSSQNPTHTYASNGSYTVTLTVTNDCGTDVFTQSVTVVAIADLLNGTVASVFPNPNTGSFSVKFTGNGEAVTMQVVNLAGQMIYNRDLGSVSGSVVENIRLQDQPAGIYFLHLTSGQQRAVVKVQVQ